MNYVPKNNSPKNFQSSRTRSGLSLPGKIVIGVVAVLAVVYTFAPRVLPSIFLGIVAPLWKADLDLQHGNVVREDFEKAYLELENNSKKTSTVYEENTELKAALGRASESKLILASILKKPPYSAYDSFILDVGSRHNVVKGNRVYSLGNVPIGEIVEVYEGVSRVRLYSSLGEKFTVSVGPSHIEATALGKGGGYFEVSLPRDTKIKVGDSLQIPQISDSYMGTVEGVISEPSEPFARILFRQPVNMYEERWVLIDTHSGYAEPI